MINIRNYLKGIFSENLVFCRLMCLTPLLAVSATLFQSFVMGGAVFCALLLSAMVLYITDRLELGRLRFVIFVITSATITTIISFFVSTFIPILSEKMTIYFPLIFVCCLTLVFREPDEEGLQKKLKVQIINGLGFFVAIILVGFIRELVGFGSLFGIKVWGKNYPTIEFMLLPAGGLLTLSVIVAIYNFIKSRKG